MAVKFLEEVLSRVKGEDKKEERFTCTWRGPETGPFSFAAGTSHGPWKPADCKDTATDFYRPLGSGRWQARCRKHQAVVRINGDLVFKEREGDGTYRRASEREYLVVRVMES